jgi:hypothetical protein
LSFIVRDSYVMKEPREDSTSLVQRSRTRRRMNPKGRHLSTWDQRLRKRGTSLGKIRQNLMRHQWPLLLRLCLGAKPLRKS